MTSELQSAQRLEPAPQIHHDPDGCLCCMHFAVDFDAMPEVMHRKRPARMPKRALARMGYDFERPDGAFYLFPRVPDEDDVRFVRRLAERLVLTVPGTGFGAPGHIRISFCVSTETIERSFEGFAAIAKEYGLSPSLRSPCA